MGEPLQHQGPDPLTVICPLCGAAPGEPCSIPTSPEAAGMIRVPAHHSRIGQATRIAILTAPAVVESL